MSCTQSTFFSSWVLGSGTRASRMPGMHCLCELPSLTHNPFRCFDIRPELFHFSTGHQLTLPVHPQLTSKAPPSPRHVTLPSQTTFHLPCAFPSFQASFPSSFLPLKEIAYVHFLLQTNIRVNPTKGMMSTGKRKKRNYTSQL